MSQATKLFVIIAGALALILLVGSGAVMARLATQPTSLQPGEGASPPAFASPPPAASPGPSFDGGENGEEADASQVDSEWLTESAGRTRIPERALQAYVAAGTWAATNRPNCGLGWNTIAAIGLVETNHGRYEGSEIKPNGDLSQPIIGAQLDGGAGVANIPDSDNGRLDGDDEYDRAVGPMQFIPDSWNRHGMDGNGDGKRDPNNIDDAAMTAASYLCASGALGTAAGWERAILSYNNSLDYVERVYRSAMTYANTMDPGAEAPAPNTVPATAPTTAPARR